MNVQDAVIAPRVHSQWLPDRLVVEKLGFPRDLQETLEARGHRVVVDEYEFFGEVHAILVDKNRRLLFGAIDPRWGTSAAAGW
jgi:gamma-glutamyltranspeptidase/glutathione hydrolase